MLTQVVLCGAMSTINAPQDFAGLSNYLSLLVNRARMEGFILLDFESEYQGTHTIGRPRLPRRMQAY